MAAKITFCVMLAICLIIPSYLLSCGKIGVENFVGTIGALVMICVTAYKKVFNDKE